MFPSICAKRVKTKRFCGRFVLAPANALWRWNRAFFQVPEGLVKSGFGGVHTESNHRLIYT
jgi:hypothetical protein